MLRCLIVTGDKPVRDAIHVGLQPLQQCEISTAEGRWVLQGLREDPIDLVIADARLGDGTDGTEFLREVRELQPDARLMLIAHGKAGSRLSGRERDEIGLCGVVRVPITTSEFFRNIARVFVELGVATPA